MRDKKKSLLYNILRDRMIHGPYRKGNINSPDVDKHNNVYAKSFSKNYNDLTNFKTIFCRLYRFRNDSNNNQIINYLL